MTLTYPLQKTLDKYGLSKRDYKRLYDELGGVCPICEKAPSMFRIDHEHAQGWSKMKPEKRKTYVRGLVCFFCNRYYLAKGINQQKARNITKYLDSYAIRKSRTV